MKVKVDMMLHLTTSARHSSVYKSLPVCECRHVHSASVRSRIARMRAAGRDRE